MTMPNLIRTFVEYLRTPPLVHAAHANDEIREEIEFHLSSSVLDNLESGLTRQESQKLALERFGDVNSVLHRCNAVLNARRVLFHRLHQFTTIALVGAVIGLCYFVANPQAEPNDFAGSTESQLTAATGYSAQATNGSIVGSVVGDRDEPVGSAHVLAVVKTWPPNGYRQQSYMTTTRPDGSFVFSDVYAPEFEYEIQVAAIAKDHLLTSEYKSMTTGTLEPICFRLKETTPFELRFESGDGQPIEGVSAFPFERIDNEGNHHSVYFSSADPIVRKSDLAGSISMPHFVPGERATVYVRFPDSDWQTRELVIPDGEQVVVMNPIPGFQLD